MTGAPVTLTPPGLRRAAPHGADRALSLQATRNPSLLRYFILFTGFHSLTVMKKAKSDGQRAKSAGRPPGLS